MVTTEQLHKCFLASSGASTDSRNCEEKVMFFALKGERFDGNKYVKDVLEKGALYAVADDPSLVGIKGVLLVEDVLKALHELARFHRRYLNMPIVAITGTNGKTTTKELVYSVLKKKYKVKATAGNFNNHIGVPLTLLSMDESLEMGIVEMGANHIGEIKELCAIAEPDFGLITNVGKAHLEGFGSFEGVKTAKGELYGYLKSKEGMIFINGDNEFLMEMAVDNKKRYEYGLTRGMVKGGISQLSPFLGVKWSTAEEEMNEVQSNLIGAYNLENILAAIAIGQYFDVRDKEINNAINEYHPTNNRSQYIKTDTNQIIMDAYNANPSSMQVALENFGALEAEHKVVILGGMKEMGEDSKEEHRALLQKIAALGFSQVYLIGEEFKTVEDVTIDAMYYDTAESLIELIKKSPLKGVYLLIKGSRSNRLETILPYL